MKMSEDKEEEEQKQNKPVNNEDKREAFLQIFAMLALPHLLEC